jgi:uncharacterized protein (TIRG00374 family)
MTDVNLETSPPGVPGDAPPGARRGGASRLRSPGFWLKLAVSLSLFGWILSRTDLAPVREALVGVDMRWLAAGFLSQMVGAALIALRWRALLAVRGVEPGYRYLFASTLSSMFFRQFLPSVIGGDALRGHDAWRAGASPGFALVSLFVDRLVGLLTLALFAFGALVLLGGRSELAGVLLPVGLGLLLMLALIGSMFARGGPAAGLGGLTARLPARVAGKLDTLVEGMRVYRGQGRVLAQVFAISLLLQVNVVTFYWMLGQALGLAVPYGAFFAIVPIAIFVMMLPITINGIGLRETMFVFLLGLWAVAPGPALAFAWLEFGTVLAVGLFGGVVYLLRAGPRTPRVAPARDG